MANLPISQDKRQTSFGSAFAIFDKETVGFLKNLKIDLHGALTNDSIANEFCNSYFDWISSSKNKYIGLEAYTCKAYSAGTSESFDKFYHTNNKRRFRCFRGEYVYHQIAWRDNYSNWKFIDDEPIGENDAVIISLPFADTGNEHADYKQIMSECEKLGVPVLIDCAYSCIAGEFEFDLSYNCITDVVFSLSKVFPIAHARIGMRLSKIDNDDTLLMYQKISYNNRIGAIIGQAFIDNFHPDYIVDKYRTKQLEFCNLLQVEPSKTVMFGLGDAKWQQYNRGTKTNRLSFHRFFPVDDVDILKYKE
jgi:hypothetical protein